MWSLFLRNGIYFCEKKILQVLKYFFLSISIVAPRFGNVSWSFQDLYFSVCSNPPMHSRRGDFWSSGLTRTIRTSAITMTRACRAFKARVTQQLPPVRRLHASRNGAPDDTGRRVEDYRVFVKRFATAGFPWRNAKCIPLLCKPRLPANSRRKQVNKWASERVLGYDRVPVMKTRSASATQ